NPAVVQVLLENKANVNLRDRAGETVLLYNARQRPNISDAPIKIARLLLANGVDVNAADNNGETSLMAAASSDMQDLAKLLIEHHADLNVRNKAGDSAL